MPNTVRSLARQIAQLAQQGHELLVVHGGGKIFTATLKRMGIESRFVNGLRVTDRETRDVAVMVMGGLLNKRVAGAISAAGQPAVGLCASDASCFLAEPMMHDEVAGSLGFVGYLTGVNVEFLEIAVARGHRAGGVVPGSGRGRRDLQHQCGPHGGGLRGIHSRRAAHLYDRRRRRAGRHEGLKAVSCAEVEDLIRQHKVSGGMVLKLEACKRALSAGVSQVRIVGGTNETRFALRGQRREGAGHARDGGLSGRSRSGRSWAVNAQGQNEDARREPRDRRGCGCARCARYMMNTYRRPPLVFVRGQGCYLYDQHGQEVSGFSGRHRGERAGLRASAAGARDAARGGARRCTSRISFTIPIRGRWRASWPTGRAWTACFSPIAAPKPSKAR